MYHTEHCIYYMYRVAISAKPLDYIRYYSLQTESPNLNWIWTFIMGKFLKFEYNDYLQAKLPLLKVTPIRGV